MERSASSFKVWARSLSVNLKQLNTASLYAWPILRFIKPRKAGRNQAWGTLPTQEQSTPVTGVRVARAAGSMEPSTRTQITKGPEPLARFAHP